MSKKSTAINKGLKEPDDEQVYQKLVDDMAPDPAPSDADVRNDPAPAPNEGPGSQNNDLPEQPAQVPQSPYTPPAQAGPSAEDEMKAQVQSLTNKLAKNQRTATLGQTSGTPTGRPGTSPTSSLSSIQSALTNAENKLTKGTFDQKAPVVGDKNAPAPVADPTVPDPTVAPTPPTPTNIPPTPPGFDQTKWNDPNYSTPKYIGGRILANGGSTQDVVNALGAGWSVIDGQRIRDPQGRTIDVMFGFQRGLRQPQWNVEGGGDGENDAPIQPSQAVGTPGARSMGGGMSNIDQLLQILLSRHSPGSSTGANAGGGDFGNQITQALLDRLAKAQQIPDMNDPDIRARLNAYTRQSVSALNRGQSKFAERAYAEGVPVGAQDANLQGAIQNSAADEGAYAGNLMGERLQQNREELMQVLQLGTSFLSAQEQRELQAQIAAIDAELRRMGLEQQNTQFYDNMGADIGANEAGLNARLMEWLA